MLKSLIEDNYGEFDVFEAETAEHALECCEQRSYDFIVLDMNMPGQDGLTVAPKIKELCPSARIAVLTANFQERVKAKAESLDLKFYEKPVTIEKVNDFLG